MCVCLAAYKALKNVVQDGGCKYFSWHDGELGDRTNHVINELLDEIDTLYEENSLIGRGTDGQSFIKELHKINVEMKQEKGTGSLKWRQFCY